MPVICEPNCAPCPARSRPPSRSPRTSRSRGRSHLDERVFFPKGKSVVEVLAVGPVAPLLDRMDLLRVRAGSEGEEIVSGFV